MNLHNSSTIIVGMSGGVDSSVSALLLKQQGYRVIGLFMKNWEEQNEQGACRSAIEYEDVLKVCDQIGIPCYSVNFVEEYWNNVFSHFLAEFKAGHTPNPDILCNREIKFKAMLNKALELGGDYLATGHYCQVLKQENQFQLAKGLDPTKDQSYFLYAVNGTALSKTLFPVGPLQKTEVRSIARKHKLATSDKKDSTGICFIGKRDFKQFLSQYLPSQPGHFEDLDGNVLGTHDGAIYYTLGQRHGMGIGGAGDPWFVVAKDLTRNVVTVARGTRHPALYCDQLMATDLNWISGEPPVKFPYQCKAKVRYRQSDQACTIQTIENGKALVTFSVPQRAVTPRQSIVFYNDNICLGGGMIESHGLTYHERKLALPNEVAL